jgi:hypothetical protein
VCCSTVRESDLTGGRSALLCAAVRNDGYEGFRGGSGGALINLGIGGADSRLIRSVGDLPFHAFALRTLPSLVVGLPFVCLPFRCGRCGSGCDGGGPSSTTQSFRSINDVFRPRFGGDGDGEPRGVVKGTIAENECAFGGIGSSRMLGESGE